MAAPPLTVGWVHNLDTTPSSSDASRIIAIASAFSGISVLSIIVRLWQRWKIFKEIGLDDIAAASSMLLGIGYSINAIFQTRWGLGLNKNDFPPVNAVGFSRVQYIGGPLYCLAILGFKVSLLASYLRLAGFNRTYRQVLYVVIALVVINQLIYTFLLSFACRPIGLGGSSLGFDVLIILLPFPILRRLQLDVQKKVALGALFALGFFVSIIQIIRIRTISKLQNYTDSEPIIIWSIVEINLGVFIACTPSFAPLLKQFGKTVSNGYLTTSQAKRQKASTAATPKSGNAANRLSKINTFGTGKSKSGVELEDGDDEVMLWGSTQEHSWGNHGSNHPMTNIQTNTRSADDTDDGKLSKLKGDDSRGQDITIMHEISVTHDQDQAVSAVSKP
ncbi:hypothetical protein LTR56_004608 [Elasticomyces elasticus]|nr:hypothetical protein LTR56_004608 [Elasticomyces elasticus]KAK3659872.1 hypothetical protein LTR22_008239 [Elasticomyces elasticus]KAK4925948.1 hypothetical protein LTR49_007086 [Elasticomyces elasticus]KAK5768184.1 hypothetical protein LTS12_001668 [Elasticomyces elasticus]